MAHREHAQAPQLLWSVEDNWREPAGHLRVQPNLDPGLDLRERERERKKIIYRNARILCMYFNSAKIMQQFSVDAHHPGLDLRKKESYTVMHFVCVL